MPGFDFGYDAAADFRSGSSFTPANLGGSSTTGLGFKPTDLIPFGLNLIRDSINYGRQKKLMDKQYQQALDQWNRQNEYNSPAAQMQRFIEAGLNPDLIYGQMGNGSPAQMMSSEQNVSGSDYASALVKGQSMRLAEQRMRLDNASVESQIHVNEALEDKYRADADLSRSNVGRNEGLLERWSVLNRFAESQTALNKQYLANSMEELNLIVANVEVARQHGRLLSAEALNKEIENMYADEYYKARNAKLWSEVGLNNSQAAYMDKMTERITKFMTHEIAKLDAETALTQAQKDLKLQEILMNSYEIAEQDLRWHKDEFGNIDRMTIWGYAEKAVNFVMDNVSKVYSFSSLSNVSSNVVPERNPIGFRSSR